MDLTNVFSKYKCIREYRSDDERSIFDVFERSPMRLMGLDLVYDRKPSFQKLLSYQARNFKTIVAERSAERFLGFFSASWGWRYFDGQPVMASYIGDFRLVFDRSLAREWRPFYNEFLRSLKEDGVQHNLTAILKSNVVAHRNLVESRNNGFHYQLVKTVRMINEFSHWRWFKSFYKSRFKLQKFANSDQSELVRFLDRSNRQKFLGFCFQADPAKGIPSEFEFRKKNWGFQTADFLVARDKAGNVVSCCLPWSPSSVKRMQVQNVHWFLRGFMKILTWAGVNAPKANSEIATLYLTHLEWDEKLSYPERQEILADYMQHLKNSGAFRKYNMISYCDDNLWSKPSRLAQITDVNLYLVHEEGCEPSSQDFRNVGFEMALV